MEHQQTCLLQASAPGTIHFLPTNAINTKLLLITADCKDRKLGSKKKKKGKKRKKQKTNRCISFPGASFTRTPFSTGLPSFPDGLFASEGEKNMKQKRKYESDSDEIQWLNRSNKC